MSLRSHAEGTNSPTRYRSDGTPFGGLTSRTSAILWLLQCASSPAEDSSGDRCYSPDGKKIAFESDRMGYSDIWMCDSDGSNCSQLTALHGQTGTARWSPNGRYISFESVAQDDYQVGVVEVPDGTPRVLTTLPGVNNGAPNWSRDGESIYFYSSHDLGVYQLWKMPFNGGSPVRVTTNGGVYAIESKDGQFLYYAKFNEPGIWKRSSG